MTGPIVVRGVLGWGNRKGGLEAYGPGGRWFGPRNGQVDLGGGDLLGDALEEAGAHEGATLLVVAIDRFGDASILDRIADLVLSGVPGGGEPQPTTSTDNDTEIERRAPTDKETHDAR